MDVDLEVRLKFLMGAPTCMEIRIKCHECIKVVPVEKSNMVYNGEDGWWICDDCTEYMKAGGMTRID